jgi:long-chain fatty acid transport protein
LRSISTHSFVAALSLSAPALADGGYFAGSKGARAAGRGGAFIVKADDVMAAAYNPAGLARLKGTLLQVGNRFSYNSYEYTRASTLDFGNTTGGIPPYVEFQRVKNETPWQWVEPLIGITTDLGIDDFGFAFLAYSPAGVGKQQFPVDGGQRFMMVQREAQIINYTASAAYKHNQQFSVGASLSWIYLRKLDYQLVIDASLLPGEAHPVSNELDMLSTVSGSDPFTLNAIVGAWYRVTPFLELGLSGQVIPTSMKTDSTLSVEPLNPGVVDSVELSRDGQPADDVTLELPLPLSARFGVRYLHLIQGQELFDVELDLVYETWSRVERFTMDGDGLVATLRGQEVDVGLIEIEKQWQDTLGIHLGGDYQLLPGLLSARAGVYYETAVANRSYAHVDFAGGQQLGTALGGSVHLGNVEVALGYEYRHQPALSLSEGEGRVVQEVPASQCESPYTDPSFCHPEYLGQPAPTVNAGTYRAHSHVASLEALVRF